MTASAQAKAPAPLPLFRQAVAFHEKGEVDKAMALYRQALEENPNDAAAWINVGTTLRQQEKFEASLACARRALEITPDNPGYLMNAGNCLSDLDREDECLAMLGRAAALKPSDFMIQRNYAIALREFGRFEQALEHFNIALGMRPQDMSLRWDIAMTYLYLGRFKEGWDAFEIRWKLPQMKAPALPTPRWAGEDISGKTLLIHEEQGFGDSILCSRYIPLIRARGGTVIVACKKPLHRLFSNLCAVVTPDAAVPAHDYHIPMMSLPGVFGTDLSNIPPAAPLFIPPSAPPGAQKMLDRGGKRLKVGIIWSGSVTFANNRKRSVAAERFLPLAHIPGVQLYSLQKGPCEGELVPSGGDWLAPEFAQHVNDFADTAAVLKQLDLVIMTDSAVAHLAGSLNVPVWNLLHHRPYWLYLSDRADSPWYPSMRLFRQKTPGDWDSVFAEVTAELAKLAGK